MHWPLLRTVPARHWVQTVAEAQVVQLAEQAEQVKVDVLKNPLGQADRQLPW